MQKKPTTDLRIIKTENLLTETFYSLLEDKSFYAISVKDICDTAMINRGTFYAHYEDKYHLLSTCITNIMTNIDNTVLAAKIYDGPLEYYLGMFNFALDFMIARKVRIKRILSIPENFIILDKVYDYLAVNVAQRITLLKQHKPQMCIPTPMLTSFFAGGIISLTKWWIINTDTIDDDEVRGLLVVFIKRLLKDYFLATGMYEN